MPQEPLGPRPGGNQSHLNITTATVVKASPGTCIQVYMNVGSGASASGVYDATSVSNVALGVTAANLICSVPTNGTGTIELNWPCQNGIVIVPGLGAAISASYD